MCWNERYDGQSAEATDKHSEFKIVVQEIHRAALEEGLLVASNEESLLASSCLDDAIDAVEHI